MTTISDHLCANSGAKCGESLRRGVSPEDCGGVLASSYGYLSNQKEPTQRQLTSWRRDLNHRSRPLLVLV